MPWYSTCSSSCGVMYMVVASSCQGLVAYSMRLSGVLALALLVILNILLIVAFEPDNLGVALEGEDMCCNAIEEPAIVRNDHGAARERHQGVLEGAQRFDVQIVGRFVEQQDVAARLQNLRQVHAIAFAARQVADHLLLLHALEIESADIAP